MEQTTLVHPSAFCWNPSCADYGKADQGNMRRFGRTQAGTQRYQSRTCKGTFVETIGTVLYGRHHTQETIIECLALLAERNRLAAIHRVKGVKEEGSTVQVVQTWSTVGILMDMDFPILTLLDTEASVAWLEQHFHPDGFGCPHCQAALTDARRFRSNRGSGLPVYRCRVCQGVYTLYSRTIFEGSHLLPAQVVLLLRGVFQGQSSAQLARTRTHREDGFEMAPPPPSPGRTHPTDDTACGSEH